MKILVKIIFASSALLYLYYLGIPNPDFPLPPTDFLQSDEPADVETSLRRGYFTDLERSEVIEHYLKEFSKSELSYSLRLNYPPEESQTLIRDQSRSTFLEEIVHPFRESIFINGFKAKEDKDVIIVNDKRWNQKVIVRYVPSSKVVRVLVGFFTIFLSWQILKEGKRTFDEFNTKKYV